MAKLPTESSRPTKVEISVRISPRAWFLPACVLISLLVLSALAASAALADVTFQTRQNLRPSGVEAEIVTASPDEKMLFTVGGGPNRANLIDITDIDDPKVLSGAAPGPAAGAEARRRTWER